jgi:ribosomal protein S12 methylthiotransferase accessory factor
MRGRPNTREFEGKRPAPRKRRNCTREGYLVQLLTGKAMSADREPLLLTLKRVVAEEGRSCGGAPARHFTAALLRLASGMERLFQLPMPEAPCLRLVGGTIDAADFGSAPTPQKTSVTGTGPDLLRAAACCICEGVEFLSQWASVGTEFATGSPGQVAHGLGHQALAGLLALFPAHDLSDAPLRWVKGTSLSRGTPVLLPAALCYRNLRDLGVPMPAVKMSGGCGAGQSVRDALLHGFFELVERDAVALWWLGGRAARRMTSCGELGSLLSAIGREGSSRTTWLLDITTDLRIPCVVALSTDVGGRGLACGFAARLAYADAVRAAVFEMCQMEVGIELLLLKARQDGVDALNAADRRYLRRAFGFEVSGCRALFPCEQPPEKTLVDDAGVEPLVTLVRRLTEVGIEPLWIDLSRDDLGIPAVRALAPGLQPYPSDIILPRLQRQIELTGNGFGRASGIALM